jgi:centrin-3
MADLWDTASGEWQPLTPSRLTPKPRSPLFSPTVRRSPLWTPRLSTRTFDPDPMATRRDRPLSAGRPISQRWREWQPEWRGNLDDVSPGLFERGGDAYRWGLYGAGRLTPRVVRGQYVDPAIRGCFERYDRNRSGRLDYRELRAALQALGVDVSRAEAADVLGAYDADGSGLMEIDEFAQLVQRLGYTNVYVGGGYVGGGYVGGGYEVGGYADAVRQTFMRFDRNRSGRLDYRELRSALRALGIDASTNQAARVLATYDADGSGLMEIDEFERLVRRLGYGPRYHGGGILSGARNGQWQTVTSPGARGRAGLPITPRRSRSAPRMRPATFGGSGGYGGYRPALLDY